MIAPTRIVSLFLADFSINIAAVRVHAVVDKVRRRAVAASLYSAKILNEKPNLATANAVPRAACQELLAKSCLPRAACQELLAKSCGPRLQWPWRTVNLSSAAGALGGLSTVAYGAATPGEILGKGHVIETQK
jgi:hypothetical protein